MALKTPVQRSNCVIMSSSRTCEVSSKSPLYVSRRWTLILFRIAASVELQRVSSAQNAARGEILCPPHKISPPWEGKGCVTTHIKFPLHGRSKMSFCVTIYITVKTGVGEGWGMKLDQTDRQAYLVKLWSGLSSLAFWVCRKVRPLYRNLDPLRSRV